MLLHRSAPERMRRCEAQVFDRAHFAQNSSRQAGLLLLSATSFSLSSSRKSKHFNPQMRSRFVVHRHQGFVARMSGDGPDASSFRTFLKPASSSHFLISLKLKVSPFSVLTSICTANISEGSGSVRSSFTSHSAMAITPPDLSERKVFLSNWRLRSSPSLCKM